MQGLWLDGARPKSKKAIKEAVADNPARIHVESTSVFGNEPDAPLDIIASNAKDSGRGQTIYFVGPCPYNKRSFYGSLVVHNNGEVRVK